VSINPSIMKIRNGALDAEHGAVRLTLDVGLCGASGERPDDD
jgi:hypothetical protein